jgi:fermentation-respiration switch protein FrsA (DUF1100 family)
VSTPALVVQGTRDESVRPEEAEAILGALPSATSRFLAVEGADHTFGASHPLESVSPALEAALEASLRHLGEHLA